MPAGRGFRGLRGRGWQRGHENDERLVNGSRRIGAPQTRQGIPVRP